LMSFEGGDTDKGAATFLVKSVLPALVGHAAAPEVVWNVQFDALTGLRRVLCHNPKAFFLVSTPDQDAGGGDDGGDNEKVAPTFFVKTGADAARAVKTGSGNTPQAIAALLPSLSRACRSLRSALAKNALSAVQDLFYASNELLLLASVSEVDLLAGPLIDSTASNSAKALRMTAASALDQVGIINFWLSTARLPFHLLACFPVTGSWQRHAILVALGIAAVPGGKDRA
jgi:hypothetical protein